MSNKSGEPGQNKRTTRPETEARYYAALELYRTTTLTVKEICLRTGISAGAFRSYIHHAHRELMFARHGIAVTCDEARHSQLRKARGMSAASHAKYDDAIRACDDMDYIGYNVSQIAHMFHLDPSSLGQQLRVHFPEIIKRREKMRFSLGLNDNLHRGAKRQSRQKYAEAIAHLRDTDDTILQTARIYKISYSGLREHLLYYHKDIVDKRSDRRKKAKSAKERGALTGNGAKHAPSQKQAEKYSEAIRLYKTTAMTQKEVAAATGVPLSGLENHLRMWHPELILERRGVKCAKDESIRIADTKPYLKSTALKYAGAIERLKATGLSISEVAREFSLNPETFRLYLHEHEPDLAAGLGMTHLTNGKRISTRCMNKYAEAVMLYKTTEEPLISIARRLGLVYNSLFNFISRNYPETKKSHNRSLNK